MKPESMGRSHDKTGWGCLKCNHQFYFLTKRKRKCGWKKPLFTHFHFGSCLPFLLGQTTAYIVKLIQGFWRHVMMKKFHKNTENSRALGFYKLKPELKPNHRMTAVGFVWQQSLGLLDGLWNKGSSQKSLENVSVILYQILALFLFLDSTTTTQVYILTAFYNH